MAGRLDESSEFNDSLGVPAWTLALPLGNLVTVTALGRGPIWHKR
jgi:hypothetical protein